MQRCQRCPKPATLHLTEVHGLADDGSYLFTELHFCEECARKHLFEANEEGAPKDEASATTPPGTEAFSELNQRECPNCGMKIKDFRSSGRLGCAHDYELFRTELISLLENIHGETQHVGKSPRRHRGPAAKEKATESAHLRKLLQQAVQREDYEEAARLRDQLRQLEVRT